jgi:hypothetical protein
VMIPASSSCSKLMRARRTAVALSYGMSSPERGLELNEVSAHAVCLSRVEPYGHLVHVDSVLAQCRSPGGVESAPAAGNSAPSEGVAGGSVSSATGADCSG